MRKINLLAIVEDPPPRSSDPVQSHRLTSVADHQVVSGRGTESGRPRRRPDHPPVVDRSCLLPRGCGTNACPHLPADVPSEHGPPWLTDHPGACLIILRLLGTGLCSAELVDRWAFRVSHRFPPRSSARAGCTTFTLIDTFLTPALLLSIPVQSAQFSKVNPGYSGSPTFGIAATGFCRLDALPVAQP